MIKRLEKWDGDLDEPPPLARAVRWLERKNDLRSRGPPCLLHNDLHSCHVLVDATTREALGVIDWNDVALGDPAVDLAGLLRWCGARRLAAALPHDLAVVARAQVIAVATGVSLYLGAERHADNPAPFDGGHSIEKEARIIFDRALDLDLD